MAVLGSMVHHDISDDGYGKKSKEHLSESVAGKFVVVEYSKRDRYERILGKGLLSVRT